MGKNRWGSKKMKNSSQSAQRTLRYWNHIDLWRFWIAFCIRFGGAVCNICSGNNCHWVSSFQCYRSDIGNAATKRYYRSSLISAQNFKK